MALKSFERTAVMFLVRHLVSGAVGGLVLGGGLLVFDVAGLGTLIWRSEHWLVGTLLLFVGLMATFGSAAIGIAVMSLGEDRE